MQENDLEETMERTFSYSELYDENGKIYEVDDIISEFNKDNIRSVNGWQIVMMYRPAHSINPSDIENIIYDLESSGEYEVKFIAHDYLKRIRPNEPTGDLRIDLGEVKLHASWNSDIPVKAY